MESLGGRGQHIFIRRRRSSVVSIIMAWSQHGRHEYVRVQVYSRYDQTFKLITVQCNGAADALPHS